MTTIFEPDAVAVALSLISKMRADTYSVEASIDVGDLSGDTRGKVRAQECGCVADFLDSYTPS